MWKKNNQKWISAHSWRCFKPLGCGILACLLFALLSGCGGNKECDHQWISATCTAPMTCSICGLTQGEKADHVPSGEVCTGTDVCVVCGAVVPASGHTWQEATCTEAKVCTRCGEVEGEPLGHDVVDGVCTRCGETFWTAIHNWGSGSTTISDIDISYEYHTLHFKYTGTDHVSVTMTDATGENALLVYTTGPYDGTVVMYGASPITFKIEGTGEWAYTIDKAETGTSLTCTGSGDGVTKLVHPTTQSYHITHDGDGYFYVYTFLLGESIQTVAPVIGAYDGDVVVPVSGSEDIMFEIHATGNWSITENN